MSIFPVPHLQPVRGTIRHLPPRTRVPVSDMMKGDWLSTQVFGGQKAKGEASAVPLLRGEIDSLAIYQKKQI